MGRLRHYHICLSCTLPTYAILTGHAFQHRIGSYPSQSYVSAAQEVSKGDSIDSDRNKGACDRDHAFYNGIPPADCIHLPLHGHKLIIETYSIFDNMTNFKPATPYLKAVAASLMLTLAIKVLRGRPREASLLLVPLIWTCIAAVVALVIDRLVIYPYMRSTLRHSFPTIFVCRFTNELAIRVLTPTSRTTSYGVSQTS